MFGFSSASVTNIKPHESDTLMNVLGSFGRLRTHLFSSYCLTSAEAAIIEDYRMYLRICMAHSFVFSLCLSSPHPPPTTTLFPSCLDRTKNWLRLFSTCWLTQTTTLSTPLGSPTRCSPAPSFASSGAKSRLSCSHTSKKTRQASESADRGPPTPPSYPSPSLCHANRTPPSPPP